MRARAPLSEYHRKRDFRRTPEPSGTRPSGRRAPPKLLYVIQRHHASRLHYDFRLELDGVLKSWAVPKGPSLDPKQRRLAVEVEDHPIEYGSFEGVIPAGQYGGGRVHLWDRGAWIPDGDAAAGLRKGHLGFWLEGEKLRGHWTLVAMPPRAGERRRNWLLIKTQDEEAKPLSQGDILVERPESVGSPKRGRMRVWRSSRRPPPGAASGRSRRAGPLPPLSQLSGARAARLPERLEPMLATLVDQVPTGAEWVHELKLDGYRILARIERGAARLYTRRWNEWTGSFPAIAANLEGLPCREALLDGELVALDAQGVPSFQALQNALGDGAAGRLEYYVFDLLHLDGYDLRGCELLRRKELLRRLLASPGVAAGVRYTDHIEAHGPAFFRETCAHRLEGIVSKRRDAPYRAGRGGDWLKVKCLQEQEFVVAGFTEPQGGRQGFGSLLLGYRRGKDLVYCGHVGTGFTERMLAELTARLRRLETGRSPFSVLPPGRHARGVHWVKPSLVAQVAFGGWTEDGVLRQPSFQGLREDKAASEVVRETPRHLAEASGASTHGRGRFRLTNPDRVLYPEQGITKLELARYYAAVAPRMLPLIARRPLALVRCPEGRAKPCFYQKHIREDSPPALKPVTIVEKGEAQEYFYIEDAEGLVSLAQLGALEIHPWGSRAPDIERPDWMVFDLDPGDGVEWKTTIAAARELRQLLREIGLASWPKTTGGKGLHVVVPLEPSADYETVKAFSKAIAELLARRSPRLYVAKPGSWNRPGRIFVDYLRNGRGALAVAPYSTRRRAGAPVATPVSWEELSARLKPERFNIRTVPERVGEPDPWAGFLRSARRLPEL